MLQLLIASYVSFVQNTKSLLSMNDIEICLTFFPFRKLRCLLRNDIVFDHICSFLSLCGWA